MNSERCLEKLLCNIDPQLEEGVYVFCQLNEAQLPELLGDCLCIFREREGISAVVPRELAERHGLEVSAAFRQITLQVYSALEVERVDAVGLTAAVAGELADRGISANVIAALHHDHVFVPEDRAPEALRILRGISNRAQYS